MHLKHKNIASGRGQGCEPCPSKPDLTAESIKSTLQSVVNSCQIKGAVNKVVALKTLVQKIIYSKASIEIVFYVNDHQADNLVDNNGGLDQSISTDERPKMPPSIFGRSDVSLKKGVAAADGFFGKGKVRNQKKAGRQGFEPYLFLHLAAAFKKP